MLSAFPSVFLLLRDLLTDRLQNNRSEGIENELRARVLNIKLQDLLNHDNVSPVFGFESSFSAA